MTKENIWFEQWGILNIDDLYPLGLRMTPIGHFLILL